MRKLQIFFICARKRKRTSNFPASSLWKGWRSWYVIRVSIPSRWSGI